MHKTLIVMALEQESRGHFDGLPILYTGVGKLNAAYRLTKALQTHKPAHVINLGSAGSAIFPTGSLVNCVGFVQRDMDATPLGFAPYETPFDGATRGGPLLTYGRRIPALPEAVCGTGDSFHTDGKAAAFHLVDMEAFSFAKICQEEGLDFTCVKFITDGADGRAAVQWENALEEAALSLRRVVDVLAQTQ